MLLLCSTLRDKMQKKVKGVENSTVLEAPGSCLIRRCFRSASGARGRRRSGWLATYHLTWSLYHRSNLAYTTTKSASSEDGGRSSNNTMTVALPKHLPETERTLHARRPRPCYIYPKYAIMTLWPWKAAQHPGADLGCEGSDMSQVVYIFVIYGRPGLSLQGLVRIGSSRES